MSKLTIRNSVTVSALWIANALWITIN